jgi:tetratricopeptide (TPR) repeat protein
VKPESIVFAIAGTCFGLIVGWVLGSQQTVRRAAPPAAQSQSAPASESAPPQRAAVLDQGQVQALQNVIANDPKNENARVQLANLYFDAEKYDDAIKWYEAALKLNPKDANVSTDLGVSYLSQSARSRVEAVRPFAVDRSRHAKRSATRNRARSAAGSRRRAQSWQKVIDIAPQSPEAQGAKRARQPEVGAPGVEAPERRNDAVLLLALLMLVLGARRGGDRRRGRRCQRRRSQRTAGARRDDGPRPGLRLRRPGARAETGNGDGVRHLPEHCLRNIARTSDQTDGRDRHDGS